MVVFEGIYLGSTSASTAQTQWKHPSTLLQVRRGEGAARGVRWGTSQSESPDCAMMADRHYDEPCL